MIKRMFFFFLAIPFLSYAYAGAELKSAQGRVTVQSIKKIFSSSSIGTSISLSRLPNPYDTLLTQPLMTEAIEKFYHRTPMVQLLFSELDRSQHIYARSIIMLIDNKKSRNKPKIAQMKQQTLPVELAFITINFDELPRKMVSEILNTSTPFGKLLTKYHLKIQTKDRSYFTINCDRNLAKLLQCHLDDRLYGRNNTIIEADNKKWLARVIEIVPNHKAFKRKD